MSSIAHSNAVNVDAVDHSGTNAEIGLSASNASWQLQHALLALRVESAAPLRKMPYRTLLNRAPVLFKNSRGQVVKITLPATDGATGSVMNGLTQAIENGFLIGILTLQDHKALITGEMITPAVWNSLSPLGQTYLLHAVKMSMSRVPNGFGYGVGPNQHRSNISSALVEARSMSRVWNGLPPSSQTYVSNGLNQAPISDLPLEQQRDAIYRLLTTARNISTAAQSPLPQYPSNLSATSTATVPSAADPRILQSDTQPQRLTVQDWNGLNAQQSSAERQRREQLQQRFDAVLQEYRAVSAAITALQQKVNTASTAAELNKLQQDWQQLDQRITALSPRIQAMIDALMHAPTHAMVDKGFNWSGKLNDLHALNKAQPLRERLLAAQPQSISAADDEQSFEDFVRESGLDEIDQIIAINFMNEEQQQSFRRWIGRGMPPQEALVRAQDTRLGQIGGPPSGSSVGIVGTAPDDDPSSWDPDVALNPDQIQLLLARIRAYELTGQADTDRKIRLVLNYIRLTLYLTDSESEVNLGEVQAMALSAARNFKIILPEPIQHALGLRLFTAADFETLRAALDQYAAQNPGADEQKFADWIRVHVNMLSQSQSYTFADVEKMVQNTARFFNIALPNSIRQALAPPTGVQRAVRLFVQQNGIDSGLLERLTRLAEYGAALAAAYRSGNPFRIQQAKDAFVNDLNSVDSQNIFYIDVVDAVSNIITNNSSLQNTIAAIDGLLLTVSQPDPRPRTRTTQYLLRSINIGLNFQPDPAQ